MARAYFRTYPEDDDPAELLEPENQWSTPWGSPEYGVFPKLEGVLAYLDERGKDMDGFVIVELEGEPSGERDSTPTRERF